MSEGQAVVQIQQSSLFVQVLVHYHWRYLIFYFLASICFFVFKKYRYYYPARIMGWEFFPVFLLVFVDGTRLLMLSRGNKMSAMSSLIYSFFWSIPVITLYAFYLDLQTYMYVARNPVAISILPSVPFYMPG